MGQGWVEDGSEDGARMGQGWVEDGSEDGARMGQGWVEDGSEDGGFAARVDTIANHMETRTV